jgi:hypothetical protein
MNASSENLVPKFLLSSGSTCTATSRAAPDGSTDPQPNENQPMRRIPDEWNIATAEYKPGARHTLAVTIPQVGLALVTTLFCSQNTVQLMTASTRVVHNQSVTPGSECTPTRGWARCC